MATRQFKALTEKGTHAVGNLNDINIKTLNHGAIIEGADVDNFTVVELGFNAEGERTAKQLSAKAKKGYLVATPEARFLGEAMGDFYNEVGEAARIVFFTDGFHFDTSAFTLNDGVTVVAGGQVAHFDVTTKKFIISTATSAHADYAGSHNQFVVVGGEDAIEYTLGQPTVRLEVTKY